MPASGKSSGLPAVVILYGRKARSGALFDDYLAHTHLRKLKAALDGEETAVSDYEADEADLAEVADELQTPVMWGGARLVIVRGAEGILAPPASRRKALAPVVRRLGEIARSGAAAGHLVLVAEGLDVRGRPRKPSTSFKDAQALIDAVDESGGLRSCVPPFEKGLKKALADRAREAGVTLQGPAADALLDLIGRDQMALQEELEKLLAAAEGGAITSEDVYSLGARRAEHSVFELADRVLDGDAPAALQELDDMLGSAASGSSIGILYGLTGSFRRYLSAALLVEGGTEPASAAWKVGVPRFVQKEFLARLARWDSSSLGALLSRALKCDVDIKSGQMSDSLALETFVADACNGRLESDELVGRWIYEV